MVKIVPLIPEDPLANTFRENYFECFRAYPKDPNAELTMEQISALLSPVLQSGPPVDKEILDQVEDFRKGSMENTPEEAQVDTSA